MHDQQSQTEQMLHLLNRLSAAQAQAAQAQQTASECVSQLMTMFENDKLAVTPADFQNDLAQMHSMLDNLMMRTGIKPRSPSESFVESHQSCATEASESALSVETSSAEFEEIASLRASKPVDDVPVSSSDASDAVAETLPLTDETVLQTATATEDSSGASNSAREDALKGDRGFNDAFATLTQQPPVASLALDSMAVSQEQVLGTACAHEVPKDESSKHSELSGAPSSHDAAMALLTGQGAVSDQQAEATSSAEESFNEDVAYDLLTGGSKASPFVEAAGPSMADVRGAFGANEVQHPDNEFPDDSLDQFEGMLDDSSAHKANSRPVSGNGDSLASFLSSNPQ